jgi:transposase
MDLKQREYDCDECGIKQHRDVNAAINIKNWDHQQSSLDHAVQVTSPKHLWMCLQIFTLIGG